MFADALCVHVYSRFKHQHHLPQDAIAKFRFLPANVGRLAKMLNIDVNFSRRRFRIPSVECVAINLCRLASPAQWRDLEVVFGRWGSTLSEIFCLTVDHLVELWG